MTIVVLGESGQLATHLKVLLPTATFAGRQKLDLSRPASVPDAIRALQPSVIVNAAGYTAVDKAESEPDLAWRVNAEGAAAIARTASALDVPLVHVSTDYVFDGRRSGEYEENDPFNPVNVYGATKVAGELAVRALCHNAWILRVSWLFSEHGTNFVKTVLRLAATRDEIKIVNDQNGRPTYAGDLARTIVGLVEQPLPSTLPFGTYHAVGGSIVSWHRFAIEIVRRARDRKLLSANPALIGIPSSHYPAAARRPANSALRPSTDLEKSLHIRLDWDAGLDNTLRALCKRRDWPTDNARSAPI
jgi:dTDP-4-dehydrorhamnose reductase